MARVPPHVVGPGGAAAAAVPAARPRLAAAIFDLSRGRQALLSIAQPALGAVLAVGGLPALWQIGVGLVAAAAGFLAVFSLNDVLDRRVDERSLRAGKGEVEGYDIDTAFERHPLARGDVSLRLAVVWVGSLAAVAAVGAWLLDPRCLLLFGGAVALETVYCALRTTTWLKTVVSGVMVGLGGLAGWAAVAPLGRAALPFFLFLALWEIGGRNIPNDLSDLDSDSRVGITSIATVFGPPAAAGATAAVGGATFVSVAFLGLPPGATALALLLGVWSIVLPALRLVRRPTPAEAGAYFNRASLYPAIVLAAALPFLVG